MRLTFSLLLLLITSVASATDYYVSTSGNDSNNGTSETTPWRSLSKVESVANAGTIHAGDRILFKKGDSFTGTLSISSLWGHNAKSGTAASPITLSSYGTAAAKPVFLYPAGGSTAPESRVLMYFVQIDYWIVDGLNFTDLNSTNNHITGANLGIPLYLGSYGDGTCNHWTIRNIDISLCGMGVVIVGDNNTVTDCNMSNFKNLKSTPNTGGSTSYEDYGANPFTLIWANNNTITHNYVSGGWAESMDFGYNGGYCETIGTCSNNQLTYNTIIDCNGLSEFGQGGNSVNNLYAYNKLIDCGAMFWVNGDCQVTNAQFFNNTIVETSNSRFAQGSPNAGAGVSSPEALSHLNVDAYMFDYSGSSQTATTVFNLKNNVIQVSNPLKITKTNSKTTHDYNVFKLSGGSATNFTLNTHDKSTSAIIFSNTGAITPSAWDLTPPPASPAIDAGTNVGIATDFIGNPVPAVPNAGILESSGSASSLAANSTAGTISCNGGTTTVNVSASGGTSPYSGTGTFTVSAGTYTYSVTDAAGTVRTTSITVTQPAIVTATLSAGTIAVFGGTTSLTVTPGGGTAPYTYKLNSGSYQSSNVFAGISAGIHTVIVKDANGCTLSGLTITIAQPAAPSPITVSAISGTIGCNGGTAVVTVSATGGSSPYTGTGTFTVGAGTYNYTVTDAAGATGTTSVTITQPTAMNLIVTAGTIIVNGGTTNITANCAGGTPGFTYRLDNGSFQPGGAFSNVAAGTHTVTVQDKNGCTTSKILTINQPGTSNPVTISAAAGAINCNGGNAAITVAGSGGTAPYAGTGVFYVTAGTYTYTITDATGASASTTVLVNQPSAIVAGASAGTITVNGGTTTITASATGGTGSYTYKLNNGSYQSSSSFTSVSAGTYTVTAKDGNGCTAATNSFTITQPTGSTGVFKINLISKTNETCQGKKDGKIVVNCTGGTAPYTYRLNLGSFTSNNVFSNLKPGFYFVTGKSATGTTATLYVYIAASHTQCQTGKENESAVFAETTKGGIDESSVKAAPVEAGSLKINIYPNPTTTHFSLLIEKGSQEIASVFVSNISGQPVFQGKGKSFDKINFGHNFAPGVYIVKVIQGRSVQTSKIIKIN